MKHLFTNATLVFASSTRVGLSLKTVISPFSTQVVITKTLEGVYILSERALRSRICNKPHIQESDRFFLLITSGVVLVMFLIENYFVKPLSVFTRGTTML